MIKCNIEIFILTYNRKEYLRFAINSLLNQSLKPSKLTIIDNGSNDGTSDLCQLYMKCGVNCIINKENNQFGVWDQIKAEVKSDYLMVFHDDDLLHFNYIESVQNIITSNDDVIMVGCATKISSINTIGNYVFPNQKIKYQKYTTTSLAALLFRGFPLPFCSIVYRSAIFKEIDFKFDLYGKFFDRPLILNFSKFGNVVIINNKMVRTFVHPYQDSNTISKGGNELKLIEVIKIYKEILGTSLYNKWSYIFLIFNFKWLLVFYNWNGKETNKSHFFKNAIKLSSTTRFALIIGFIYYYCFDLKSKARWFLNTFK